MQYHGLDSLPQILYSWQNVMQSNRLANHQWCSDIRTKWDCLPLSRTFCETTQQILWHPCCAGTFQLWTQFIALMHAISRSLFRLCCPQITVTLLLIHLSLCQHSVPEHWNIILLFFFQEKHQWQISHSVTMMIINCTLLYLCYTNLSSF